MASHTDPGDLYEIIMEEKRRAILNHLIGEHEHPENVHYKKCNHGAVQRVRMDPGMLQYILL